MSLTEPMFERQAVLFPRLLVLALIVLVLILAFPFIYARFPTYASGYLIQIPAVIIGYWYLQTFHVFSLYTDWKCRGLLLLSFVIPLQNTFWIKAFRKVFLDSNLLLELLRPEVLLFIAVAIGAAFAPRNKEAYARIPGILKLSFLLGFAGWIVSTAASANPLLAFSTGIFEFIIPFASLYVFVAVAPDRTFMRHAITLFIISYALVSLALISATLTISDARPSALGLPLFAIDFLNIKRAIRFIALVGGNAYENPDFFISLWVMIIPFLVVFYYPSKRKRAVLLAIIIIFYAGFLQYSRAGIAVVAIACLFTIGLRLFLFRRWSWVPALLLLIVGLIFTDVSVDKYFNNGLSELIGGMFHERKTVDRGGDGNRSVREPNKQALQLGTGIASEVDQSKGDTSGDERALAWNKSLTVAMQNWWTGIGYGNYPIYIDATPPHSLLLYRFAEGGILGLASILMLAFYAPWRIVVSLHQRDKDMFLYAVRLGLSCFMLKALPFSSSFSLVGIIVWGFGFAMMLASSIGPLEGTKSLSTSAAPTFAVPEPATSSMEFLWRSKNLATWRFGELAAKILPVIWVAIGAATMAVVALALAATSSFRENSNAAAVARYGVRLDTESATIDAALREAAASRQQQDSLIKANAQLANEIANLKEEIGALKRARAAPRAVSGHWKRRR
jgi:O-Antigen ligase